MKKFQLKLSQYVCYVIWESHYTKIIVGRLLKLQCRIFVSINQNGTQILSSNVLEQGLWKDLEQLRSSFFGLCSYFKLLKTLTQAQTMVESLQFHSSTRQIHLPLFPKILCGQNWLKFISGNYNVCETISSFIKNVGHVVR